MSQDSSSSNDEDDFEAGADIDPVNGGEHLAPDAPVDQEALLALAEYADLENTVQEIDNFLNGLAQSTIDLKRDAVQLLNEIRADNRRVAEAESEVAAVGPTAAPAIPSGLGNLENDNRDDDSASLADDAAAMSVSDS